jgi:hypothetical protein
MASKFPQTLSLLEALDIDGANRLAFFARQKAHSGVAPHSDCKKEKEGNVGNIQKQ